MISSVVNLSRSITTIMKPLVFLGLLNLVSSALVFAQIDKDAMGRRISSRYVWSTNTLNLGYPHQGQQHGMLLVRKIEIGTAEAGTEVTLSIKKGIFACDDSDCRTDGIMARPHCSVNVRFDDEPVEQFVAVVPSPYNSTMLYIQPPDPSKFVSHLGRAREVTIEAAIYQQGPQTLKFDLTQGFNHGTPDKDTEPK